MSETTAENLRRHAKNASMTHGMAMQHAADELDKHRWRKVEDEPVPFDTDVLVCLEKESLARRFHSANYHTKLKMIGHYFAFDCPKVTHWKPITPPEGHKG